MAPRDRRELTRTPSAPAVSPVDGGVVVNPRPHRPGGSALGTETAAPWTAHIAVGLLTVQGLLLLPTGGTGLVVGVAGGAWAAIAAGLAHGLVAAGVLAVTERLRRRPERRWWRSALALTVAVGTLRLVQGAMTASTPWSWPVWAWLEVVTLLVLLTPGARRTFAPHPGRQGSSAPVP